MSSVALHLGPTSTSVATEAANEAVGPEGVLAALRRRRDGGEALPGSAAPLQLAGRRMLRADLAGLDLSLADLTGCDLSFSDLRGSQLVGARLDGAVLHGALLDDAELMGASLKGVDLTEVRARRAGFGGADLSDARALSATLDSATLSRAVLGGADLRGASLRGARILDTVLDRASFASADLREADLTDCSHGSVSFRGADLREARLRGARDYRAADWVGADLRHADFCGAWLLRRHALDENYLHEFRNRDRAHEWVYRVWWATSDCGRSVIRWAAWTALMCVVFAGLYAVVGGVDYGDTPSVVDPLYFSVVTFTTLGYGDILPVTGAAKLLVVAEVVFGYMALGGVLSILAAKMGSRAG